MMRCMEMVSMGSWMADGVIMFGKGGPDLFGDRSRESQHMYKVDNSTVGR